MADIKNILVGASGLFTSILGLASNNPTTTASGMTSFFSILSPTQRSMIQYGSNQATMANQSYTNSLAGYASGGLSPLWIVGGLVAIIYLLFKKRR